MSRSNRFLFSIFLWAGMAVSHAEPSSQIPPIDNTMTQLFDIQQHDLPFEGKTYRLFLATPKQLHDEKLPVLYLLDGNAQFPLAVNLLKKTKKRPLVVGIGYANEFAYDVPQRTRDYTFKAKGEEFAEGGGAVEFLRFVRTQVKSFVEARYTTEPHQQHFFGHSFGGLFGLYVLLNQPELFQFYTLASPSLWWGNGAIVPPSFELREAFPPRVLVTLGEYEAHPEREPNVSADREAKIKARQHIYPARQLARWLNAQGFSTHFYQIPQQNHGGAIEPALERAISQLPE